MNTLAEALVCRADNAPSDPAFSFIENDEGQISQLSNAELASWAWSAAQALTEKTRAGQRIVLLAPEGLEFIAGFYACILSGRVVVPTYPPNSSRITRATTRLNLLIRDADPDVILTTQALAARITALVREFGWWHIPVLTVKERPDSACRETVESMLKNIQPRSPAIIQYTSGSTSQPKGVVLSHHNLINNARGMQAHGAFDSTSVGFSWLPPYHDMGLISGLTLPVCVGYHSVLCAPSRFLRRPASWLESIDRFGATITGGPNFAFDLCVDKIKDQEIEGISLSSLKAVFNGAEPVRSFTLARFAARFKSFGFNPDSFSPVYGLAETTLMAAGIRAREPAVVRVFDKESLSSGVALPPAGENATVSLVSCGTPLIEHAITIHDSKSSEPLGPGVVGEIYVDGPSIASGYFRSGDADAPTAFCLSQRYPGEMQFQTGDLGFILDDHLFITGRIKDLIIVRGKNFYPQDMELSAGDAHPAIDHYRVCAFSIDDGMGEQLVIVCEIKRAYRRNLETTTVTRLIRKAVTQEHNAPPAVVSLVKPGTIPLTTSGKIQRNACRDLFFAKEWNPIYQHATGEGEKNPDSDVLITAGYQRGQSQSLTKQKLKGLSHEDQAQAIKDYLATVVSSLLNLSPQAVVHDRPLIESGVDSLSLVELGHRIRRDLDCAVGLLIEKDLSLDDLVREILVQLSHDPVSEGLCGVDRDNASNRDIPMSPIHLELLDSGADLARQIVTVYIRLPLQADQNVVKRILSHVLAQHGVFYLRKNSERQHWRFVLSETTSLFSFAVLKAIDLEEEQVKRFSMELDSLVCKPFDLIQGPLVHAVFVDKGPAESGMLVLSFSHTVVDAISLWILSNELEQVWAQRSDTAENHSPVLDQSGLDWNSYLHAHAQSPATGQQTQYWMDIKKKINGSFVDLQSRGNREESSLRAVSRPHQHPGRLNPFLSLTLSGRFASLKEQHDVFLTAFLRAWYQASGNAFCAVSLESHGRQQMGQWGISGMPVGWFTMHFPVVFELDPDDSIWSSCGKITTAINNVPEGGSGFGLLRYLCCDPEIQTLFSKFPVPLIRFVYRGKMDQRFRDHDAFKILDASVQRPYKAGPSSSDSNEILVFVRHEVGGFSWNIESTPGTRTDWKMPPEEQLVSLMEQALNDSLRPFDKMPAKVAEPR
jgi:acyl-CoA synthetase (AMP-forming)/AMP-acid ligase II/aryl carrier-like protein